jgi:tRNA threonylcarbamoyladenosine biosynthesis protein TsaB
MVSGDGSPLKQENDGEGAAGSGTAPQETDRVDHPETCRAGHREMDRTEQSETGRADHRETGRVEQSETDGAGQRETGWLLAIDTATSAMSVALLKNGEVCAEINSVVERNHSVYLTPAIEEALGRWKLRPRDLAGIAVGKGPGSYTGVRIGITVAKTMAWALKVPVAAVSTLEPLAAGALAAWVSGEDSEPLQAGVQEEGPPEGVHSGVQEEERTERVQSGVQQEGRPVPVISGAQLKGQLRSRMLRLFPSAGLHPGTLGRIWVVPLLNARRGQAFTALYALEEEPVTQKDVLLAWQEEGGFKPMWPVAEPGWSCKREDGIRLMERWVDELLERAAQESPDAVLFAGETAEFDSAIGRFLHEAGERSIVADAVSCSIQSRYTGYLGALRLGAGAGDEAHNLLPNYTQLTEAEVNLNARNRARV